VGKKVAVLKRRISRNASGAGEAAGSAHGRRHRVPAIALALLALAVPVVVVVSAPVAAGSPAMVRIGATPRVPAGARSAGALPATAAVSGTVVLNPRDNGALQRFIGEVTDRSSPRFHGYLPAGAFASRFGPSPATIDAVRSQLRSDGLSVKSVSGSGMFVNFSGSASRVESAFHTGLTKYRLADGTMGRATTSAPLVPASIAGSVAAILGLNELVKEQPAAVLRPPASDRGKIRPAAKAAFAHPAGAPMPCSDATKAANAFGGLTDDQIAHAYGAFGLYGAGDLGAGQRIALYELEPFARSDIQTFDTCYFGASAAASMLARLKVVPVDGGQPAGSGSGESNLDVEDISAIAPGAGIDVYTGPSPGANGLIYDPVDPYVAMVDNDRDQVISTSWGLCEQAIQAGQPGLQEAENLVFEQAAAQGQTVFDASGDNGSDDCNTFETPTPVSGQNPLSIDDPSGQPYVVSVGGTTINDASGPRPQEQVWNDGATEGAAGGGISMSWAMPAWQRIARIPGISLPGSGDYTNADSVESAFGYPPDFCQSFVTGATSTTPCRLVPDVSAQADQFTGAITVFQAVFGGWTTVGGTSSSAPIWAAMLAVANASATCTSQPSTTDGVGFASPLLYQVASKPAQYAASFNDVTSGNNDIYGLDNGLVFGTRPGYDLGSGLGSPRLSGPGGSAGLAFYLCSAASAATRPVVTALTPKFGSTAGGEHVTISGSGFETGASSNVAALQIGSLRIPAGALSVNSDSSITVTMPAAARTVPPDAPAPQDGAGPVDVIVVLKDRQSSAPSPSSTFTYVDTQAGARVPSVTGVVPTGGPESAPGPVTILGAGFRGATRVTFGGLAAPQFTVNNDHRITVTPPAFSTGQSACVALPDTGVYVGENATNDVCQVQVRVSNSAGVSATSHIRPPFEGAFTLDALGVLEPPPGCGCETQVAPTEFDYAPAPKISSISTSNGPSDLASEKGTTVITVHGVGLGPLTIDWADVGDPGRAISQDVNYVFVTGRMLQIIAPRKPLTVEPASFPFSVKTLAGQSPPVTLQYAGIPSVTSVVNTTNSKLLKGISGSADTGGTPIDIAGQGFEGQVIAPIDFSDPSSPFSLGTQYTFTVHGDTSITTSTVEQDPALVDVEVCTVTGCSHNPPADLFYLYPPGDPKVTSLSPTSGPAAGGTTVTIHGQNLGCPLQAFFGDTAASSLTPVPGLLDCGSTTLVRATSPAGTAGRTVPVTVTTVESFFTGSGRSTTKASFTYN
jgi:hypothetical protein